MRPASNERAFASMSRSTTMNSASGRAAAIGAILSEQ